MTKVKMINTKINGKYELILPEHRVVRSQWETGWEAERIDSMMDNLKDGDVVFDIGTEEGDITGLLAKKVGNTGGIVMFEPNPRVWANIKAIWDANKLKHPLGFFVGFASDQTLEKPHNLNIDPAIKEGWPVYAFDEVIGDHSFRHLAQEADATPQITLDEYCKRVGVHPNLITIDVEGSELNVLKGAEEILKDKKPLVYVSIHVPALKDFFNLTPKDLHTYMESLGYQGQLLAIDHEEHWLFKSEETIWNEKAGNNAAYEMWNEKDDKKYMQTTVECVQNIIKEFSFKEAKDKIKLLEIGCGIGRLTNLVAEIIQSRGYKVLGVDVSPAMINMAKIYGKDIFNAEYQVSNGRDLASIENESIDGVYSMVTFQHIPQEAFKGYIKEVGRVLKMGGKFRFQYVEGKNDGILTHDNKKDDVIKWLEESGFEVLKVEEKLMHHRWTWITARKI